FVGGYRFALDAGSVTLFDVFGAVGEQFIKTNWRSGSAEMDCPIAAGMGPLMDEVFASLEACCGEKLKETRIADIDARLFPPKA
ncbi:transcriptional regulator, partial [Clostridium perfringens]